MNMKPRFYVTNVLFLASLFFATSSFGQTIMIGSLTSAQVSDVFVKEGQQVKTGQAILNLDVKRYQAKEKLLKANLKAAQLDYDDAKIEYDQAVDLYDRTVTSKRTFDAAKLMYDLAKSRVDQASAELELHQTMRKYVFVSAPVNAEVVKVLVSKGSTVFEENTPMVELKVKD
jgi:p-hydroxybenzoic acid efflux pump subunit AaeA